MLDQSNSVGITAATSTIKFGHVTGLIASVLGPKSNEPMKELIFSRLLAVNASLDPDKPALVFGDLVVSHRAFRDNLSRVSSVLSSLGIAKSDCFGVISGNNAEYVDLWFAALSGQGVLNPLNIRLGDAELTYIINDSGLSVLFCDMHFSATVARIRSDIPGVKHVVQIGGGEADDCDTTFAELLENCSPLTVQEVEEGDPCILMYTGGTTGLPKGVVLDQRAMVLSLYRIFMHFGLSRETNWLMAMPMFHIGALPGLVVPILLGGTLFLQAGFDPEAAIDAIDDHKITDTGFCTYDAGHDSCASEV